MSTKTLGVVCRGSGRQNSIPTIPTIPTVPTIPTIPTPWGCSKLKPLMQSYYYSAAQCSVVFIFYIVFIFIILRRVCVFVNTLLCPGPCFLRVSYAWTSCVCSPSLATCTAHYTRKIEQQIWINCEQNRADYVRHSFSRWFLSFVVWKLIIRWFQFVD